MIRLGDGADSFGAAGGGAGGDGAWLQLGGAITSDSRAFVLVTCAPNSRDANAPVVPRSFGRPSSTGPAVVFTVTSR